MEIVRQLATDVLNAIAIVHAASVVHCDIKSLNYLVKVDVSQLGSFHAVLTDFGVCKILKDAVIIDGLSLNTVVGRTQAHSPPETFKQEPIPVSLWPARDVYAATVVLNEFVIRQFVWKGMSNSLIAAAVLGGGRPMTEPVEELVGHAMLPAMQQLINRGWA